MRDANSHSPRSDLPARLELLQAASDGKLEELTCPQCGEAAVSIWFTYRSEGDYWTWFLCNRCDFEMRAQGNRPAHYSRQRERSMRAATEQRG